MMACKQQRGAPLPLLSSVILAAAAADAALAPKSLGRPLAVDGPFNSQMEEAAAQPRQTAHRRPAPELPVFCVSTREAHKLEGRCRKDGPPTTFKK